MDIEAVSQAGESGDFNVCVMKAGEWMQYTVNITQSGDYNVTLRVASAVANAILHLEMDGVTIGSTFVVPNSGGWQTWTSVTQSGVRLTRSSSARVLRVLVDSVSSAEIGVAGNLNWIEFKMVTSASTSPASTNPSTTRPFTTEPQDSAASCWSHMPLAVLLLLSLVQYLL